jgi:hypothetical protein
MVHVVRGRFTAQMDEPFVVFLIGMRINRFRAVRKWWGTFVSMPPMLRELKQHREKGLLGMEFFVYWRGIAIVQYWRSFEDLERFARTPSEPHLPTWRWFNHTIGSDGTVGFWHETYIVKQGQSESIYNNMPLFGLAAATKSVPAVGRRETARRRLGYENEPAVPTPSHY